MKQQNKHGCCSDEKNVLQRRFASRARSFQRRYYDSHCNNKYLLLTWLVKQQNRAFFEAAGDPHFIASFR